MSEIAWRCPYKVYMSFVEHLHLLSNMTEGSDDYEAIIEAIRGLPGFPHNYDEDLDTIVLDPYPEYILQ